jgi:hypothetical protein
MAAFVRHGDAVSLGPLSQGSHDVVGPTPSSALPGSLLVVGGFEVQPTFEKSGYITRVFLSPGTHVIVMSWPGLTSVTGRPLVSCLLDDSQQALLRFNSLTFP